MKTWRMRKLIRGTKAQQSKNEFNSSNESQQIVTTRSGQEGTARASRLGTESKDRPRREGGQQVGYPRSGQLEIQFRSTTDRLSSLFLDVGGDDMKPIAG
jgi:hypothetical protein